MKIKAFTILEVVITIAITAILISLVFSAINFLNAQSYREMESKDKINEWMILRKQIIEDVYLSNSIEKIESGMKLQSGGKSEVIYQVENGILYIEKDAHRIKTNFEDASCSWFLDENDREKCTWTINVLDEPMQLSFYAFSTRADRINHWYNSNVAGK